MLRRKGALDWGRGGGQVICRWGQGSSWDALAKMRSRCPAALDAGDLGVWSSRRAVPLRPSRCSRAAGLGGARRSRGGGVSFAGGDPPDSDHPRVEFSFGSPGSSIWRLANNLVLTPSPHSSLRYTGPIFPPQTPPTGMDKGTKVGQSPAWKEHPRASHSLYSRTPSPKKLHPSFHI